MDFSALHLLAPQSLWLMAGGCVIGIFAVVFGGAMFFALPFIQAVAPGVSYGAVLGNIKVGSFFRSIGSTLSTWRQIAFADNFKISTLALAGTVAGASAIADLSQAWLLPSVALAIALAFLAPKIAPHVTEKTFGVAAFFTGVYAGIFGAGIGIILIALLRLKHPAETSIGHVKIQARFVEWILVSAAVLTHLFHSNIIAALWVPWSAGSIVGGYIGGVLLKKMGALSGTLQKAILYTAFALAFAFSALRAAALF